MNSSLKGSSAKFDDSLRSSSPALESASVVAQRLGVQLDRYARARTSDGRSVRVFFSSTSAFRSRDLYMLADREAVFKIAIPRLWRTLYERGLFFIPVDLRWGLVGLDERELRAGKLLLLTLREVARADYFMSILKGRYGWQQTPGRGKDELLALAFSRSYGEFPTARACSKQSFTEVEIRMGALADPGARRAASVFYFASPELIAADRHASGGEEDAHASARLTALKAEIRAQRMRVREYRSPAELAAGVHDDVMAMVDRDFPQGGDAAPWLERQRAYHAAYGDARRAAYVRPAAAFEALDGYAAGKGEEPLYVVGGHGAGKTALLANWAASWADRRPGSLVFTHFVPLAPAASGIRPLLERVHEEVRLRFPTVPGLDLEGAPGDAEAASQFRNWLAAAAARLPSPLVLVVDGLDALRPEGLRHFWVPPCGATLRVLLSCLPQTAAGKPSVFTVPPLGRAEREALAAVHAEAANSAPPALALERLLATPQSANPLFLLLALQAARFAPDAAAAEAALKEALRHPDLPALYGALVARWVEAYGDSAVRVAFCAAARAREGISESELQLLLGVGLGEVAAAPQPDRPPPPPFHRFVDFWQSARAAGLVIERAGLWSLDQAAAAEAVETAFGLGQVAAARRWEAYLASFFTMLPACERRALAASHHNRAAGDTGRLYALCAEGDVLRRMGGPRHRRELASHWRATGRPADAAARYEAALGAGQNEAVATGLRLAGGVLRLAGGGACTGEAAALLARSLAMRERLAAGEAELAEQVEELLAVHVHRGDYPAAQPLLERLGRLHALARDRAEFNDPVVELGLARDLHASGALALARGDVPAADGLLSRAMAVRETRAEAAVEEVGASLHAMGLLRLAQGRHAHADDFLQRALRLREATLGVVHTDVAATLCALAALRAALWRPADAESLYRRALTIRAAVFGEAHESAGEALDGLARLALAAARHADADAFSARALAVREAGLPGTHPEVAAALETRGALRLAMGKFDEAEQLFARALRIREAALAEGAPATADAVAQLAALRFLEGRYADAEPLFARALRMREAALGGEHADVGRTLAALGRLRTMQGRHEEADELLRRAIAIHETAFGSGHPEAASSTNALGELRFAQGRLDEARALYLRSREVREGALGAQHPDVAASLSNAAGVLFAEGRLEEADAAYKACLRARQATLGEKHPDVARVCGHIARVYEARGLVAEARAYHRRALAALEAEQGPETAEGAAAAHNLAVLFLRQGKLNHAEPLFRRALAVREAVLGAGHGDVGESLLALAGLCHEQGRAAEAEALYRRTLAVHEAAFGSESAALAPALSGLAGLLAERGAPVEAEPLLRRGVRALRAERGEAGGELAAALCDLGALLVRAGRPAEAVRELEAALRAAEAAFGQGHEEFREVSEWLADAYEALGRPEDAATHRSSQRSASRRPSQGSGPATRRRLGRPEAAAPAAEAP